MIMKKHHSYWTYSDCDGLAHVYYFSLLNAVAPPYLEQRRVEAILDIASDGTLAGVELVFGDLPPPPLNSYNS